MPNLDFKLISGYVNSTITVYSVRHSEIQALSNYNSTLINDPIWPAVINTHTKDKILKSHLTCMILDFSQLTCKQIKTLLAGRKCSLPPVCWTGIFIVANYRTCCP
jgi:hypothetical protein